MSLQIWLPLNKQGDFTNRGVGELNITSNTAQYNNEGKIGGCAEMISQSLVFNSSSFNSSDLTEMTVCAWVYLNEGYAANNGFHLLAINTNACRICFSKDGKAVTGIFGSNSNRVVVSSKLTDKNITSNKWYHIALTVKGGEKARVYINGELDSETSFTKPSIDNIAGQSCGVGTYSGEKCNGKINDFRLYDHALSPREVKEISQGLVVHYKLNDICGKNLFVFENRKYTQDNPFVWTSKGTDANSTGCRIKALDLVPGKTYTFSCCTDREIGSVHDNPVSKDKVALWLYLYHTNEEVNYTYNLSTVNAVVFLNNNHSYKEEGYNRYSWRYTIPDGYQACCVRVNHYSDGTNAITSKYWDFKLEKEDVYTPDMWDEVPYDSSGYNNNGTITGNFTMQGNSPRYDKCVKCNGVNNILLKNPLYNYYDSFTFSFWYKHSSENKEYNIITSNKDAHPGWWISCNTENKGMWIYLGMKYITSNPSIDNNWHHWVVTYTKDSTYNNYKLYLDGVLQNTSISSVSGYESKIPTFNEYLMIGGEKNSTSGHYYNQFGNISDFRIYSTALSADDVKDLYETSASIDNHGVLHAYDIVENTENIFTLENLLETVNPDRWVPGSNDYRDPRWVMRNGQAAMSIGPSPFWWGAYADSIHHLGKYFKAGKQYKIDLWIDADDIYDSTSGQQALGGIRLVYTDGSHTSNNLCAMGDANNPRGFQHVTYYTDPTKTVRGFYVNYILDNPAYYRSDSSITEMKDIDIQKCGIVEAPWLVDTKAIIGTRSQYDTNIYEEPDGSRWIRVFHHANPSSSNLFSSTDSFTTHVYKDANRWFDVSICNQLSSWELMIKQKPSSTDTLQKYRWKQYVNPMLATESDVSVDKVTYNTSTGYTSSTYGGLFKLNEYTYLTQGAIWWGAVGSWTVFQSGIPGWNKTTISSTGYMDLYVRIDDTFQKETNIYDNKIECNSFIEN